MPDIFRGGFTPRIALKKPHIKKAEDIPFNFVLDRLDSCSPVVKPMFGCYALYRSEKIVLILRDRESHSYDNGVWVAIGQEHHQSFKKIFPCLRSIRLFGRASSWLNIPASADDFEECVMKVCDMILKNDSRIGKIPKPRRKKAIRKR